MTEPLTAHWLPRTSSFEPGPPLEDAAFVELANMTAGTRFHRLGPGHKAILTVPEVYALSVAAHGLVMQRAMEYVSNLSKWPKPKRTKPVYDPLSKLKKP